MGVGMRCSPSFLFSLIGQIKAVKTIYAVRIGGGSQNSLGLLPFGREHVDGKAPTTARF